MFKVDLSFLNWNFINSLVICPTIEPLSSWLSLLWANLFHSSHYEHLSMHYACYWHCHWSYEIQLWFPELWSRNINNWGRSDCSALALDASRLTKSGMPQKGVREMLYATIAVLTIFGAALTPLTICYH